MLTIGEVAKRAGVSRKAIRIYEERRLLPTVQRNSNGYRVFDETAVDLVTFVRQAREIGLSLDEVGTILATTTRAQRCDLVQQLAKDRIVQLEGQIAALSAARNRLTALARAPVPTSGEGCLCVLIEDLSRKMHSWPRMPPPDSGTEPW